MKSVREGRQRADRAASKLDSGLGWGKEIIDYAVIVHVTLPSANALHLEKRLERWCRLQRWTRPCDCQTQAATSVSGIAMDLQ